MEVLGLWENLLIPHRDRQIDPSVFTAQTGDLVEFMNPYTGLSFWAVYEGDGHVVHLALTDESMTLKLCRAFLQPVVKIAARRTRVRREHIHEMRVPPGTRIRVNNTKHRLRPSPEETVRQRCQALLHHKFTFDSLNLNSEHFATFVRYGQAVCNQIPFKKDRGHADATQAFQKIMQNWTETET